MQKTIETVYKEALGLSAIQRAALVDRLLSSLDNPDKVIDEIWQNELNDRMKAYKTGKMETVSVEEVLAKYKSK